MLRTRGTVYERDPSAGPMQAARARLQGVATGRRGASTHPLRGSAVTVVPARMAFPARMETSSEFWAAGIPNIAPGGLSYNSWMQEHWRDAERALLPP